MNIAKYCRQQPERFDCMFKEHLLLSKLCLKKPKKSPRNKPLHKAVQPHLLSAFKAYGSNLKNLLRVL